MQDRAHQSQGRRQLNDRVRLTPVHPSRELAQPMERTSSPRTIRTAWRPTPAWINAAQRQRAPVAVDCSAAGNLMRHMFRGSSADFPRREGCCRP